MCLRPNPSLAMLCSAVAGLTGQDTETFNGASAQAAESSLLLMNTNVLKEFREEFELS